MTRNQFKVRAICLGRMPRYFLAILIHISGVLTTEAIKIIGAIFGMVLWPIAGLLSALYLGDRK